MTFRKAQVKDIDQIEKIYDQIHDEEEAGNATIGWVRCIYPARKTEEESLGRDDLFVMEDDGCIVAAAIEVYLTFGLNMQDLYQLSFCSVKTCFRRD